VVIAARGWRRRAAKRQPCSWAAACLGYLTAGVVRVRSRNRRDSLKFDGKEYPEHSPRLPAGITVSAEMTGARTLRAYTRLNGKVFDTEDWEVSADGKTFTYKQLDEGTTEPVVIVQHRIE
jgi:ABC-type oligopeptide transport system substrate-binding subunit